MFFNVLLDGALRYNFAYLASCWAILGFILGYLGVLLVILGGPLGHSGGSSWGALGPLWATLRLPSGEKAWDILQKWLLKGFSDVFLTSYGHLAFIMAYLLLIFAHLRPTWSHLGPSWPHLGRLGGP